MLAGDFGDGGVWSVVVDGPVVDPFAEAVGVEDGPEQDDGLFGGIPVFERVAMRDFVADRVCFGGFSMGWWVSFGSWFGRRVIAVVRMRVC